jgi:hypothetical protein
MTSTRYDVVIPTIGRPSLTTLLSRLAQMSGPRPGTVVLVDDRGTRAGPLPIPGIARRRLDLHVVESGARGPAAARNAGWNATTNDWVVFLDDDVDPEADWYVRLADDLRAAAPDVAGIQGHIVVPGRARDTDRDRDVRNLERAHWATADMAYRRGALVTVGGFDERFPRAYREDADLALRILGAGLRLSRGARTVRHPVQSAPWWISVARQRGNADDALMLLLHGRDWWGRAGAPRGDRRRHLATTLLLGVGVSCVLPSLVARSRRPRSTAIGAAGLAAWGASTAALAARRLEGNWSSPRELAAMATTSAAIPPVATWWWFAGLARAAWLSRPAGATPRARPAQPTPDARPARPLAASA